MPDNRRSIRPAVPTANKAHSAAEKFQNQTLRPILKLQNNLLLAIFREQLRKRKIELTKTPELSQQVQFTRPKNEDGVRVQACLQKDRELRYILLGIVLGQFTLEEWTQYRQDAGELRKRVFQLLEQRLLSQLDQLR